MKIFTYAIIMLLLCVHQSFGASPSWILKNPKFASDSNRISFLEDNVTNLGFYPVTSKIEKLRFQNEAFENVFVCIQEYKVQVIAKNYSPGELSFKLRKQYRSLKQKIKSKLDSLATLTNPLPGRVECEFQLNGTEANAYPVAVIFFDVFNQKIRGQIFTGFQTDPEWQVSVSTRTLLTKNQLTNIRGLVLSQFATPAISLGAQTWSYHGAIPGGFSEVATTDFQFLY